MSLPADLRQAASELDRSIHLLKDIGCDDEQLLDGNAKMAALIRSGADEIDRLTRVVELHRAHRCPNPNADAAKEKTNG